MMDGGYVFTPSVCEEDIKRLRMDSGKIWWICKSENWLIGCVKNTNRLDFDEYPDPDPAYQWDTKRKLFSLAEVSALPSAVLCYYYKKHPFLPPGRIH